MCTLTLHECTEVHMLEMQASPECIYLWGGNIPTFSMHLFAELCSVVDANNFDLLYYARVS